ncbi:MAG: hypothetical protein PQ612_08010 [Rickettsiales bacterium]|nr:hypothetical protein [Pseudomonadota bacterium]MDG4543508.1 hypothetical protein [Rickettsiales bacterium]MDG4546098.1 hypothetical protein [Rickettsiales bacterium]MDG4547571.1 hypothetical protein [Rickettsiales bacterium]
MVNKSKILVMLSLFQGNVKNIIFIALFFVIVSLKANTSHALSEYGAKCDNNPDCVECRDEVDDLDGIECQQCMHACWNMYGPAEFDDIAKRPRTKIEQCRMKWAKWCNAQCWDPDDKTNPEYVSTKPICNDDFVFPKYNGSNTRPW